MTSSGVVEWLHVTSHAMVVTAGAGFVLALALLPRRRNGPSSAEILPLVALFASLVAFALAAHALAPRWTPYGPLAETFPAVASWAVLVAILRVLPPPRPYRGRKERFGGHRDRSRRYRDLFEHGEIPLCEVDLTGVRSAVCGITGQGVDDVRGYAEEHPEFVRRALSRARVVDASRQCLEMFGLTATSDLDGVLDRVLVPETLPALPGLFEAVARTDCTARGQIVLRRVSGERLHVVVSARLPAPHGPWNRILVNLQDLTEFTLSEERFRLTVEGAPTAMVLADSHGRIVLVNSQAEKLFGWQRWELLGRPVEVLVPERYRSEHPRMRRSFLAAPTPRAMGAGRELFGLLKDGREVPIEIGLNPLRTPEGIFVLSSIIDITERKRSEERIRLYSERLERTNKELETSNQELENFAHVASHDLQEPLRKITAFSGILVRDAGDGLNDSARRDLRFITDAADRMRNLVRDLLALSRAGRDALRTRSLELDSVLEDALQRVSVSIEEAGAVIERGDLPVIQGDRTLLTELFQNLLSNAIKFRREDRPLRVVITVEAADSDVVIGVRDNGIGIDPEYREQIFAPFRRLHGRDRYDGTGIGLAVCRHAVERHGGRIWVEAAEDGGSHFRFTLPGVSDTSPDDDASVPSEGGVQPLAVPAGMPEHRG